MDSEGKRYKFIRGKIGLSKKDFAESFGLSMSMGSQIASSLIKPSRSLLNSLANTYNVNLHWFLTGKGPSGLESGAVDIELLEQEAAGRWRTIPKSIFSSYLAHFSAPICRDTSTEAKGRRFPSGSPLGSPGGRRQHDRSPHLRWGHSHLPPRYYRGNGIFVIAIGNSLVVKRIDGTSPAGPSFLYSANPAFEPRRFPDPELDGIRIAGKVVVVYHRV
jgi:transcriptional regulator with XRE-family HTH domain